VRFTCTSHTLYASMFGTPRGRTIIPAIPVSDQSVITLLGHDGALAWERIGDGIAVTLPTTLADAAAYTLRITPISI
jgi:hypothetical protein